MDGFGFTKLPVDATTMEYIGDKVSNYRESRLFIESQKLVDSVANIFKYKNVGNNSKNKLDSQKLEYLLLYTPVIIGFLKNGNLSIIGYPKTLSDYSNNSYYLYEQLYDNLKLSDLHLLVPITELSNEFKIATPYSKGNMFILFNNRYSLIQDSFIIRQGAFELSEIKATLYSLSIQAKAVTYFVGDQDDVDLMKKISAYYGGNPLISMSNDTGDDTEDLIGTLDSASIIPTLVDTNKNLYKDCYTDTQIKLGIVNTFTNKESGVSNEEIHAGDSNAIAIFNTKLKSRKYAIDLLNSYYPDFTISIHSSTSIEDIDENLKKGDGIE